MAKFVTGLASDVSGPTFTNPSVVGSGEGPEIEAFEVAEPLGMLEVLEVLETLDIIDMPSVLVIDGAEERVLFMEVKTLEEPVDDGG